MKIRLIACLGLPATTLLLVGCQSKSAEAVVEIPSPKSYAAPTKEQPVSEPAKPTVVLTENLEAVVESLSTRVGYRFAGSAKEKHAAKYLAWSFRKMGYEQVRLDPFQFGRKLRSENVVCVKPAADGITRVLVVGGHYDSKAPNSVGAVDNASGIAALIEAARLLEPESLPFEVHFVAFGAEERLTSRSGHHYGSQHYAASLKQREVIGMINLDMACGKELYIGSMELAAGWLRDVCQSEATAMGLTYKAEKEGANSDHEAFERRGIPVAYIHYWPAKGGAYHNAKDVPKVVDYGQVKSTTELVRRTVLAAAMR